MGRAAPSVERRSTRQRAAEAVPGAPAAPTAPDASTPALRRVSLPLRDDGTLAVDRMRVETRDTVARLLADPATGKALGLTPDTGPRLLLPAVLGVTLVDAIANLDLLIMARLTAAPLPIVRQHGAWSETDKAMVQPALMAVLEKHGGVLLAKWGDEVALVAALASITTSKVQAIREAVAAAPGPSRVVPFKESTPAADAESDAPGTEDGA